MKNKKIYYLIPPALLFLPMPFVWLGYGEAGIYGFSMFRNGLFLFGGILLVLALFFQSIWGKAAGWIGAACLFVSYGGMAISFQHHFPWNPAVLEVCRLPMGISFAGAILVAGMVLMKRKEKI